MKHSTDPGAEILRASLFAARAHAGQSRKGAAAEPYVNHVIEVAAILAEHGAPLPVVLAGLLHDTVEDTETTIEEIRELFGPAVAAVVAEVTDDTSLPRNERRRIQLERAGGVSREAKLVKIADKICNLRDVAGNPPAHWPLERRQAYFEWARAVIDGLRPAHPALERLFDEAFRLKP